MTDKTEHTQHSAVMDVAVRLRPAASSRYWEAESNRKVKSTTSSLSFQFDHVFDETTSTEDIYKTLCSPIVKSYVDGFNATIFAYGQTASGKSFTMLGSSDRDITSLGIIPSSLIEIFDLFQQQPDRQFLLSVSYMEIYNEKITDLFYPDNDGLRIRQDQNGSVAVSNLTEVACKTLDQIVDALTAGNENRTIGETNFNLRSSRAHTILTILLQSRSIKDDSPAKVSSLNLVDLAGSERPSAATNETQRFKEGAYINSSLLALGNVISSLSEGRSHIPYRDSKLTRILQSSLGGNSRTVIICTISPNSLDETTSTLRFASRAKTIKNKPIINEVITIEQALRKQVASLTHQIEKLKKSKDMDEERKQFLTEIHSLEEAKDKAEGRVQALEQHLEDHVISTKSIVHENDEQCSSLKDRRKTYLVESIQPREKLLSSPLLKSCRDGAQPRRRTMFQSRSKNISFVSIASPLSYSSNPMTSEDDVSVQTHPVTSNNVSVQTHPVTSNNVSVQTHPVTSNNVSVQTISDHEISDVVENYTQTIESCPSQSNNSKGTQTESSSVLLKDDQTDQCILTNLDRSYLCQHRTNATVAIRDLENAKFVNDEYIVQLIELEETIEEKDVEIKCLKKQVQGYEKTVDTKQKTLDKFVEIEQELFQEMDKTDQLKEAIEEKDLKIGRLKEENTSLVVAVKELKNSLAIVTDDNRQLECKQQSFGKQLQEYKKMLNTRQKTVDKFQGVEQEMFQKMDKLKKAIEERDVEIGHLKDENTSLVVAVKELKNNLAIVTDDKRQLECKQQSLGKQIQGYEKTIDTKQKTLDKFVEIEQELFQEMDKTDQLKEAIEEKDLKIGRLKEENTSLVVAVKELKNSLAIVTDDNRQLECKQQSLSKQLQEYKKMLNTRQKTVDKFQGVEQELFQKMDKLKKAIEERDVEIGHLKDEKFQEQKPLFEELDKKDQLKEENTSLKIAVAELKADLAFANEKYKLLISKHEEETMTTVNKLEILDELTALRKDKEVLIMKLRFVCANLPTNTRVGRVEDAHVAGLHKLIENLEAKYDRTMSDMLRYRKERNMWRKKYVENNEDPQEKANTIEEEVNVIEEKDRHQKLEEKIEKLDYERMSCLCDQNKLRAKYDNLKQELLRYRRERDEVREKYATLLSKKEDDENKQEPLIEVNVQTQAATMAKKISDTLQPPLPRIDNDPPPSKDDPKLFRFDTMEYPEDINDLFKVPFNVYEKTPEKRPSHPDDCRHQ